MGGGRADVQFVTFRPVADRLAPIARDGGAVRRKRARVMHFPGRMHSMKRVLAFFTAALLALVSQAVLAQPTVRVITGNPLTINVGSDASFQVYTTLVPGAGQFFPSGNTQTADMGVFARMAGVLYAPAFSTHPGGTATGSIGVNTPWTPVSISPVTGTGTAADPFTVVVVADAAATGLRMTMTVTYVNGENFFRKNIVFTSATAQTFDVFLGGDIYLANSDSGIPFFSSGAVGGQDCGNPPTYTILFIPVTAANRYSARGYSTVWSEIGAGLLSNVIKTGCQDNGAALQWQNRALAAGGSVAIQAATSFGAIPPIVQGPQNPNVPIPTPSEWTLMLLVGLMAFAGVAALRRR
jgi:hypothetical protein